MKQKFFSIALLSLAIGSAVSAQTIPVGSLENVEDAYRRQQLLGNDTSNCSFMVRPVFINQSNEFDLSPENGKYSTYDFRSRLHKSHNESVEIYALPFIWQQQYNTHHPYGWNDGAMVPAKGYETLVSAGIFAKLGFLSIQFKPEYVFAENKPFRQPTEIPEAAYLRAAYREYYGNIDEPVRFGQNSYSKFNWGQSSIRVNYKSLSLGLSNESLWWGPGVRNSLLMSNNADGFKHITFNTTKPIKTYIGNFEGQIMAGRLEKSGYPAPDGLNLGAKPDDWRYINGMVLTYQPKWVPGLYLGLDRTYIIYSNSLGNGFFDYLPIFSALEKSSFKSNGDNVKNEEDLKSRDQRLSFFARWVMPESHAEVYLQYGKNDHNQNTRDIITEPEHSRAYIMGLRKLVPLNKADEYIQVGLELTQLQQASTKVKRPAGYWYTHTQIVDGYTNRGQIIGAGIGNGSNLQSLDVSWVKGFKKIGLQLERFVHNNDLMYNSGASDIRRHWVDISFIGKLDWTFNNFIFNTQLGYINSLNYQYELGDTNDFWNFNKRDASNLHLRLGIMYRL